MSIRVLIGRPNSLTDKQLKAAILLGCLMLVPTLVLSLLKGFMTTNLIVDGICYALTCFGWFRVITCENHAMERRQGKISKAPTG